MGNDNADKAIDTVGEGETTSETPAPGNDYLLTTEEVASLLKMSPRTIQKFAKENRIPAAVQVGRKLRFHRAKLFEWLDGSASPAI